MPRLSDAVVITTNSILALIGLASLCFSIYVFITGPSQCQRFIQNPLIITATLVFFISTLGLIAALYGSHLIITLYLFLLFLAILLLLALSIFSFLVTNPSAGKAFSGKGIGNAKTGNLRDWIENHYLTGKNWEVIKKCLAESKVCKHFGPHDVHVEAKYLTDGQFGCCRPPVECGFEAKNVTFWTVPVTDKREITGDCKAWSNIPNELCYSCETCKLGILKGIRKRWKYMLIWNLSLIVLVVLLYSCGCCVRNNNRVPWKRRYF